MANTLVKIGNTVTVGSGGATSISFDLTGVTGYTDLYLKWSLRSNRSSVTDPLRISFNNLSSSFTNKYLSGNSSSAISGSSAQYLGEADGNNATASTFANGELYIPNYAGSNYKSASSDNVSETNSGGAGDAVATVTATLWSNTSAITSIKLTLDNGSFMQNSTATLYGITAYTGDSTPKAVGGTVTSDSTYYYHTFTTSNYFTPLQSLNVDYLVVGGGAGGGSGASGSGGGGGAGGRYTSIGGSQLAVTAQRYSVTVGAGGARGIPTAGFYDGYAGSSSVFSSVTATGGGIGAGDLDPAGTGACGGGAKANSAATGGTGTLGYNGGLGGNAGGSNAVYGGGGGGGMGSAGGNYSSTTGGGAGGTGVTNSITGNTYCGGGGGGSGKSGSATLYAGGTGGSSIGGSGASGGSYAGSNAVVNTGSGGGGGGYDPINSASNGGNGSSGIVVIRYAK